MPEIQNLTLEEASAALAAMAAGRRDIPSRGELRTMVAAKRCSAFTPATAKLFSEVEHAATCAKRTRDPVARAAADLVTAVIALVRHEIEHPEQPAR